MAYGASGGLRVKGLAELQRALKKADKGTAKAVRKSLEEAGEKVKDTAEQLASTQITNIGEKWSGMRVGVRTREVYVAPRARRSGGSPRPNLGRLLMKEALLPAVDQNERAIERGVERALDHLLDSEGL